MSPANHPRDWVTIATRQRFAKEWEPTPRAYMPPQEAFSLEALGDVRTDIKTAGSLELLRVRGRRG